MQIQIIATPVGTMLSCLSYSIVDGEVVTIGNNSACKIALPSSGSEKEHYGRITQDNGQWSLESYEAELFSINHDNKTLPRGSSRGLNDGDLISCRGYQLMFSDFSPWKPSVQAQPEQTTMAALESLADPTESDPEVPPPQDNPLDDPFLIVEVREQKNRPDSQELQLYMSGEMSTKPRGAISQGMTTGLIDVLSEHSDPPDLVNDPSDSLWSAEQQIKLGHRMMDHFPVHLPQLMGQEQEKRPPPEPVTSVSEPLNQAMLQALQETLAELAPDQLVAEMRGAEQSWLGSRKGAAFWQKYSALFKRRTRFNDAQQLFIYRVHKALRKNAMEKRGVSSC